MTEKKYSEIVKSASEMPEELFVSRWMLMPEIECIPGTQQDDLDKTKKALSKIYKAINLPLSEIRAQAGLSQGKLAARFAIPLSTVCNWEARKCCPVYVRLMIMEALDMWSPYENMGVEK